MILPHAGMLTSSAIVSPSTKLEEKNGKVKPLLILI